MTKNKGEDPQFLSAIGYLYLLILLYEDTFGIKLTKEVDVSLYKETEPKPTFRKYEGSLALISQHSYRC